MNRYLLRALLCFLPMTGGAVLAFVATDTKNASTLPVPSAAVNKALFDKAAFSPATAAGGPHLYASISGAPVDPLDNPFALTRVDLSGSIDEQKALMTGISPTPWYENNGAAVAKDVSGADLPHPLVDGAGARCLTLLDGKPVFSAATRSTLNTALNVVDKLFLVSNPTDATTPGDHLLSVAPVGIVGAAGASWVRGLAAGDKKVFAAITTDDVVTGNGGWDIPNATLASNDAVNLGARGIAVFNDALVQAPIGGGATTAIPYLSAAAGPVAFPLVAGVGAVGNGGGLPELHWSSKFSKLYVGLGDIAGTTPDFTTAGFVYANLVVNNAVFGPLIAAVGTAVTAAAAEPAIAAAATTPAVAASIATALALPATATAITNAINQSIISTLAPGVTAGYAGAAAVIADSTVVMAAVSAAIAAALPAAINAALDAIITPLDPAAHAAVVAATVAVAGPAAAIGALDAPALVAADAAVVLAANVALTDAIAGGVALAAAGAGLGGGLCGLVCGIPRADLSIPNFAPFVEPVGADLDPLFVNDQETNIFGAKTAATTATDLRASSVNVGKIRVMTTSTNKDYIIVQSSIRIGAGGATTNGIFAMPLRNTPGASATHGLLASVGAAPGVAVDFAAGPVNAGEMPLSTNTASLVAPNLGVDTLTGDNVKDIFVQGDSVFIFLGASENTRQGVFRSTALFDAAGAIIAWTPAERVGGPLGKVIGGGVDALTGNVWTIGDEDLVGVGAGVNTARVTVWDSGGDGASLAAALAPTLKPEDGGVHALAVFNEATSGFAGVPAVNLDAACFSMAVAAGKDAVAIVQLGSSGNPHVAEVFTATTPIAIVPNLLRTDAALKTIAPLTCCEVSRDAAAGHRNWIFVGGYNGVSVLSLDVGGLGYADLNQANLALDPFIVANGSFKQLVPNGGADLFKGTSKIVSLGTDMFVVANGKLYTFVAAAAKFPTALTALDESSFDFVANPALANAYIHDVVILSGTIAGPDTKMLLATSAGLFYIHATVAVAGGVITPIAANIIQVHPDSTMPAVQIKVVSANRQLPLGSLSPAGTPADDIVYASNILVLFGDNSKQPDQGEVRRYAINVGSVTAPVAANNVVKLVGGNGAAGLVGTLVANVNQFTLNEFRSAFEPTGLGFIHTHSRDFKDADFVREVVLGKDASGNASSADLSRTDQIADAEAQALVNYIGGAVVDPASGKPMVFGDFGVRMNG